MHRNQRLTQIVRILRTERRICAEQLADRFTVSPRTIYRDIALLHRMGVPVVGEAGVGYHLDHGARLPAVRFTADELEAMFHSAQLSLRTADAQAAEAILRVMTKVKDALPSPMLDTLGVEPHPMSRAPSAYEATQAQAS